MTWVPTGDGHHLWRVSKRSTSRCPHCRLPILYDMHYHPLPCPHGSDYRYERGGPTYNDRLRDGFDMIHEGEDE